MWQIAGLQNVNKNSDSSKTKTQIVSAATLQNDTGKTLAIEAPFIAKWILTTEYWLLCMC